MRFGAVALAEAEGAILAHSLRRGELRWRKGMVLSAADIGQLANAGIVEVVVALLEAGDVGENMAAAEIGAAGKSEGIFVTSAFAGRVNLVAEQVGVLGIKTSEIEAFNRIDPAITLATLPRFTRVDRGQIVATLKIIPYAAKQQSVRLAAEKLAGALRLHRVQKRRISLILTEVAGLNPALLEKGRTAVEARLARLGVGLTECRFVPHHQEPLAEAIRQACGDIVLILGASATSDIADTGPEALRMAGGEVLRFGIPVDPGNLLFVGTQGGRGVLGLPGCVRSLALNGADWVLERMICGLKVDEDMLVSMGVGGLLKEVPARPLPRRAVAVAGRNVAVILLAAGRSKRMQGRDKMLEPVGGDKMISHAAKAALSSTAGPVFVVLPPQDKARRAALDGLDVRIIEAPDFAEGMGGSLRNAIGYMPPDTDAIIIALADMPEITAAHFDALKTAYDPAQQREICRAVTEEGHLGHPVLFGRRFFENLAGVAGDAGARGILREYAEFVTLVTTPGEGAALDLDTPAAWENWRNLFSRHS